MTISEAIEIQGFIFLGIFAIGFFISMFLWLEREKIPYWLRWVMGVGAVVASISFIAAAYASVGAQ